MELIIDKSWTLFLDRDGVINKKLENDYVKSWVDFEFLPGVLESIKNFKDIFGKIIIVTNQQGIGKGLYTHEELAIIHEKMTNEICLNGGRIDKIYYSPNLNAENSILRKPNIGMGLKAKEEFPEIDFKKSIIIGDSVSDMQFGKNLGMITFYVTNKEISKYGKNLLFDFIINGLDGLKF